MDAETRSALLTLAKAIVSLSEEAAAEVEGQYANGEVTTGVRFPMEGELFDLIDRLQAAQPELAQKAGA